MLFVGIDVSKSKLDIFIRKIDKYFVVDNTVEGISKLLKELKNLEISQIIMEGTGGYENLVFYKLVSAKYKVSIVNPRQVRGFAKASGKLAKTDKIDCKIIAHFGEVFKPKVQEVSNLKIIEIQELLTRRNQLKNMIVSEKNRLLKNIGKVSKNVLSHLKWLEKNVASLDKEINKEIEKNKEFKGKKELLKSIPGVGEVLSNTLVLELPELGKISNKEVSALVGLAPVNKDSGYFKGKREGLK